MRIIGTFLWHNGVKHWAPGAVAVFVVADSDFKITSLSAVRGGEVDKVLFPLAGNYYGEFFGGCVDFGQVGSGRFYAGGREQAVADLVSDVGVGVGEAFGAFGVFVMEYEHGGSRASDFGGSLRAGDASQRSCVVGDF